MVVVSSKRSSVHYPAAAVAAVVLIMATACSVLAFVVVSSTRHRQQQNSNSEMMSLFMSDNLKSILSTSDYDLGVSEVNKGKVVKTAVQKVAKTVVETPPPPVEPVVAPPAEIVTSSSSSPPPPPPLPEQVSAKTSAAADSTLNIEIPSDISEKMSQPFEGLNGFLKTTQESLKASSSSSGGASSSTAAVKRVFESSPSPPAEGKALPLSEFMKAKFTGGTPNPAGSSDAALADSKEKLDILMNNLGEFFSGLSASIQGASQGSVSIGGPASTVGFSKSISDAVDQLPEGSAPWIAVGFGVLLLAAGTKKDDEAEIAASSSDLKASSAKLGDLTGDLEILQKRMREMEKSGVSVSSDLKAANEMLLRKELEISKERLKALDTASKLQRQIETLQLKLKQNDGKFQTLDKELMNTKSECEALSAELLKAKEEQTSKPVSPKDAPKKKASAKTKAAPKKAAPKTAAPKKAAPKKAVEEALKDELPSASASTTTSPKTSTKTKSKKKVKKAKKSKTAVSEPVTAPAPAPAPAAPASGGGTDDWSTLSKSTLTRKTVKELQEYLDTKGVTTTDSDGKPLKKALLVDAVLSQ
mmetsp:Transcript_42113/g.101271  ORF Transcript_42113/g.101271 Transcript_42113/m.101271 type:complete len:587 (+) Transcript_42113:338-2098(+)